MRGSVRSRPPRQCRARVAPQPSRMAWPNSHLILITIEFNGCAHFACARASIPLRGSCRGGWRSCGSSGTRPSRSTAGWCGRCCGSGRGRAWSRRAGTCCRLCLESQCRSHRMIARGHNATPSSSLLSPLIPAVAGVNDRRFTRFGISDSDRILRGASLARA